MINQEATKKHVLQTFAEYISEEVNNNCEDGISIHSYSGRGMFGKECLGITFSRTYDFGSFVDDLIQYVADLDEDERDEAVQDLQGVFKNMRTDSMGRGTVSYWPNVVFVKE
jgi:uncharacterized protein YeeX (DUF496 family)